MSNPPLDVFRTPKAEKELIVVFPTDLIKKRCKQPETKSVQPVSISAENARANKQTRPNKERPPVSAALSYIESLRSRSVKRCQLPPTNAPLYSVDIYPRSLFRSIGEAKPRGVIPQPQNKLPLIPSAAADH